MDFSIDSNTLLLWLTQYGSIALFTLLFLGIFALPVPDETLMVIAGALIHAGKLHFFPTILAAYLGAICGITLSYLIGRTAGKYLIRNYGKKLYLSQERVKQINQWFLKFGKWTLTLGYFIPGVRHLAGFFAGMSFMNYTIFSLFAYSGAILWSTIFLSIGYLIGDQWDQFHGNIKLILNSIFICSILACLLYFAYKGRNDPK